MKSPRNDSDRITDLETALMHLQNDFEQLNEVVLENGRTIAEMQQALIRLTGKLDAMEASHESRSLEDDKPPHY